MAGTSENPIRLPFDPAAGVPGQRFTSQRGPQAYLNRWPSAPRNPDGSLEAMWWAKGPFESKSTLEDVFVRIMLLKTMPGTYPRAYVAEAAGDDGKPTWWIMYENVAFVADGVRRGVEPIPVCLEEWTSGAGASKEQRVVDWASPRIHGIPLSRIMSAGALTELRFGPIPDTFLVDLLLMLFSRTVANVGDNAPRNFVLRLSDIPRNLPEDPDEAIFEKWSVYYAFLYPKVVVSIDFEKAVDESRVRITTGHTFWHNAVGKKFCANAATILARVFATHIGPIRDAFAAVDLSAAPADARRRYAALEALLADPAETRPPGPTPAETSPPAPTPAPEVLPLGGVTEWGLKQAATITGAVIGTMDPDVVADIGARLAAKVPTKLTLGQLASFIQKAFRSGSSTDVLEGFAAIVEIWDRLVIMLRHHAIGSSDGRFYQATTTFIFGRMVVCLYEDSAASPEAVGMTIGLSEDLSEQWAVPRPDGGFSADLLEWLDARAGVIRTGLAQMATIASSTRFRMRPASLACCPMDDPALVPWPKAKKGVKTSVVPKPGSSEQPEVNDLPPVPKVAYDPKKSYGENGRNLCRVAYREIKKLAEAGAPVDALNRLIKVVRPFAGCYTAEERRTWSGRPRPNTRGPGVDLRERQAALARNEAHMFVFYVLAVVFDPSLHPRAVTMPPPADLGPQPLTAAIFSRSVDKHCGRTFAPLGFTPSTTIGAGNDYHDIPAGTDTSTFSAVRLWLSARQPVYEAHRAATNRAAAEAPGKKRPAASGPAAHKRPKVGQ